MVTGRGLAGEDERGPLYATTCDCGFKEESRTHYLACPKGADDTDHSHMEFKSVDMAAEGKDEHSARGS
jgi:hypothetical protein